MRNLIVLFLLAAESFAFAQTPVTYTGIIQAENNSDNELYLKGLQWMALTFKSANDVIQFKDQQTKTIIGKATLRYETKVFLASACTGGHIDYSIKLEFKPGRFKYTITDFYHRGGPGRCQETPYSFGIIMNESPCNGNYYPPARVPKGWMNNLCEDMKNNISITAESLISSLNKDLAKISINNTDDW